VLVSFICHGSLEVLFRDRYRKSEPWGRDWWCLETGRQKLSLTPHGNGDRRNWGVRKVNQLRVSDTAWKRRMTAKGMLSVNSREERERGGS